MSYIAFVIANDNSRLMPTRNPKKVRRLLKEKKAIIYSYEPFTIKLLYKSEKCTQDIELCVDIGYNHQGMSIKSRKQEFVSEERTFLLDEKDKHQEQLKIRRARRNRLRYRKPRFDNRAIPKGWIAPSLRHKKEAGINVILKYCEVLPITSITLEVGNFDTHAIKKYLENGEILEGIDYQHGDTYGYDSLREAIFSRDNYTCAICKKGIKDNVILRMHHINYYNKDRSNRPGNLLTVCINCHNSKNHGIDGALWGLKPKTDSLRDAAYMNIVKYSFKEDLEKSLKKLNLETPINITYGAVTKRQRLKLNIPKTHANDAYCMGSFRPKYKIKTRYFKKIRRNNRKLEKFYDSKVLDTRTNEYMKGNELSCNRTNRSVPRNNPLNERIYRGPKKSKGKRVIRKTHYKYKSGDIVNIKGMKGHYLCKGINNLGKTAKILVDNKYIYPSTYKLSIHKYSNGWIET